MTIRSEFSLTHMTMLFTLFGGAALGAVALALTQLRTKQAVRSLAASAPQQPRGKAEAAEDVDTGTIYSVFI